MRTGKDLRVFAVPSFPRQTRFGWKGERQDLTLVGECQQDPVGKRGALV